MSYLSEIVYGGVDGIITTFVIIAGASGATFSSKITILLGLASIIADGFSMGVSSYLAEKMRLNGQNPVLVGIVTFAAFIVLGVIPLLPFIMEKINGLVSRPLLYSSLLTVCLLFGLGFLKGSVRNALETVLIGTVAAAAAYWITKTLNRFVSE